MALGALASMTATAQTPALLSNGPVSNGPVSIGTVSGSPSLLTATSSSPARLLAQWREDHGSGWRMRTNSQTGTLEMLFGANAQSPFEPNTSVPEDWFALARYWAQESYQMHGIEDAELVNPRFRYLPLAMGNTTDKITVRFEQVVAGVPVEHAALNVLFDTQGRLLSIHVTGAPSVEDAGAQPLINAGFANLIAARAFEKEFGLAPTSQGNERLVHAWIDAGETREWQLCWQVEANFDGPNPIGRKYTIDALGRNVLKSSSTIHNFDVFGTVRANATPGTAADSGSNPPTPIVIPRTRVSSSAGTVETDRDGNFNFAGVNTALDLTVDYFGEFTDIRNSSGADYTITFNNVQPGIQNDLLANASPSQNDTAQANTQIHINVLRDYIRDRFPTDNTAEFRARANVNIGSNCNAFYNGSSVNFYTSGGGCNNTAFSTVVAHEMGHWLNQLYGTGNGGDGMGEGNADVFAMYAYDTPVVGSGFSTGGGAIRTGTNTRQFCGDANPGCYGGVHTDGQVWMGAAWKVRTNLNTSLGNAQGDMVADSLFLGWMNSFNQTGIRSIIETQWLTLDDDNGNIDDGTPNFSAIDDGFRVQGFPGFDLPFVTVSDVSIIADTADDSSPFPLSAIALANLGTTLTNVEVIYSVNGASAQSAPLSSAGGSVFDGSIPSQMSPSVVRYFVRATDDQGNSDEFPEGGLSAAITFSVGTLVPISVTSFEQPAGWTAGAAGDDATTGIWTRGNPVGTAAQPENDNTPTGTNCWFTGQGTQGGSVGANDVDGGRTTLLSPVFDAGSAQVLNLSYARWYSNDEGGAPNADVFDVDVSNDGGTSWVRVERVGPSGADTEGGWLTASYDLALIVTPSANMRVRFVASDENTGSIVEAAIDDVSIVSLEPSIPLPTRYCDTTVNSTGLVGMIGSAGSQRISDNNFRLVASGLPAGQFGLFFFGPDQVNEALPGTLGRLCVGGTIVRLPIIQASAVFGSADYALDFTGSTPESAITAGSVFNFQLWFRDIGSSNTTDALSVEFRQ